MASRGISTEGLFFHGDRDFAGSIMNFCFREILLDCK